MACPVFLIFLLAIGGGVYYQFVYAPAQTMTTESELQTAVARLGDLTIYASGTGTLFPKEEYDLGFKMSGRVTGIFVAPGDLVKAGDVLAQVDGTQAQAEFADAKRAYDDLASDAAIASALQSVADAKQELLSAKLQLEYLISPDVMYWETEVERAQRALDEAQAAAAASPADVALQQAVKKANDYFVFAQGSLAEAWETYNNLYVWKTFPIREDANGNDYLLRPTEDEIFSARADIEQARRDILESEYLYMTLTGQPVPDDAASDGLDALRKAQTNLENAQAALDGTCIVAPVDGIVMSVNISVGNPSGVSTAIVVDDLSQAYLQVYFDASDWDKVAVGEEAQVTFDELSDTVFTGTVTQLDSGLYSSRGSTMIQGMVLLDSSFDTIHLPINSPASVDVISAQTKDAVLIPVEALHETSPGKYAVFVMVDGVLRLRVVQVGIQDTLYAEIVSGLEAGDVVSTGITQTQ
jgi:multidrug efflux pump subunit AcrA (membrane-fusion protein)